MPRSSGTTADLAAVVGEHHAQVKAARRMHEKVTNAIALARRTGR
jgi:hypothetical protein